MVSPAPSGAQGLWPRSQVCLCLVSAARGVPAACAGVLRHTHALAAAPEADAHSPQVVLARKYRAGPGCLPHFGCTRIV